MNPATIHQRFAAQAVQQLHRVPLFSPVLIWVRHGCKRLSQEGQSMLECPAGHGLILAAGETPLMQNLPSAADGYLAELFTPPPSWTHRFAQHYPLQIPAAAQTLSPFACDQEISQQLEQLITLLARADDLSLWRAELTWHGLLLTLASRGLGAELMRHTPPSLTERCRQLLAQDLAKPWQAAELAAALALSESTLRRQLREEATCFSHLLSELRLASAFSRLMTEETAILTIALDCGFQSPSRFSSNFRHRFGMTPSAIRDSRGLRP